MKDIISKNHFEKISNSLDIWISADSGWVIDKTEGLYINVANYEPLSGSSYIALPKVLDYYRKGLINIKNKDHKCFLWCHVRLINTHDKNAERMNEEAQKIADKFNYSNIEFPLNINDYELIEDRFNMNINVFGYQYKVYPLYVSKKSYTQVLNSLLITQDDKSHYVFIKDFNKLMYSNTKCKDKKRYCMHCLQIFTTE